MTMNDIRDALRTIPINGKHSIRGLTVERATATRWCVNLSYNHAMWLDLETAALTLLERGRPES